MAVNVRVTTLRFAVSSIIKRRAEPQVRGVTTEGVVACMEHVHSFGDRSIGHRPGDAMSSGLSITSISLHPTSEPVPAIVRPLLVDLIPEQFVHAGSITL